MILRALRRGQDGHQSVEAADLSAYRRTRSVPRPRSCSRHNFGKEGALAQEFGVDADRTAATPKCAQATQAPRFDRSKSRQASTYHVYNLQRIMTESDMLRLAKAFLDIALWRQTPAYLPASPLLLALVGLCRGADWRCWARCCPRRPNGQILLRIVLGVAHAAGVYLGVAGAGAPPRSAFLQTATALLGVGVLAEIDSLSVGRRCMRVHRRGPIDFAAARGDSGVAVLHLDTCWRVRIFGAPRWIPACCWAASSARLFRLVDLDRAAVAAAVMTGTFISWGSAGTFMGGVAAIAKAAGFRVTGSDLNVYPPMSTQLKRWASNCCRAMARNSWISSPTSWWSAMP